MKNKIHASSIEKVNITGNPLYRIIDRLGKMYPITYIDADHLNGTSKWVHRESATLDPLGNNLADYILNAQRLTDSKKIQVFVPTYNSETYLLRNISDIYSSLLFEKRNYLKDFDINLLVGINGKIDYKTIESLSAFIRSHKYLQQMVSMSVFHSDAQGKINAMNIAHQIALENNRGYLLFVDDDVSIKQRAISNIINDIHYSPQYSLIGGYPVLNPCNETLTPLERSFYMMSSLKRSLTGYSLPMGRLMGLRTESYPVIPVDFVADDVFLNGYFLHHKLPMYNERKAPVEFYGSSSFYMWLMRSNRIASSDDQVINTLPLLEGLQLKELLHNIPFRQPPGQQELRNIELMKYIKSAGSTELKKILDHSNHNSWGVDESTKGLKERFQSSLELYFNDYLFPTLLEEARKYVPK
ncbi:MAG: hypothetical protein DKM50_02920 [Candidatus Margulisiibacteriota bacterium]|nr:MAG: hypothetical protein DKM50_02920 [Candidatus Margulisiibacteriota bacterium]HCY37865.1 hypothetical protein [Candidatus Margulisiibacteriota bacterium]